MLGAIIGDTVGSHYEFHNTKDYDFELYANPSSYTDDTVMTMAVASWLLHDKEHSYQGLEDAMVLFAGKYRCPSNRRPVRRSPSPDRMIFPSGDP